MSNINDYLDAALKEQSIPSDRQLALRIGEPPTSICQWRAGERLPRKDASMIRLAELAGFDVEVALADLNQWRAERADDPATASVYAAMRRHLQTARQISAGFVIGAIALAAVTLDPSGAAYAGTYSAQPDMLISNLINYTHEDAYVHIVFNGYVLPNDLPIYLCSLPSTLSPILPSKDMTFCEAVSAIAT